MSLGRYDIVWITRAFKLYYSLHPIFISISSSWLHFHFHALRQKYKSPSFAIMTWKCNPSWTWLSPSWRNWVCATEMEGGNTKSRELSRICCFRPCSSRGQQQQQQQHSRSNNINSGRGNNEGKWTNIAQSGWQRTICEFCFCLKQMHYLIDCLLSDYQQLNTPLPFTCRHHEHVLSNNDDNNLRQTTPHKKIRSSVKWRGRSNSKSIEPCVGDMVREWIPSVKLVGLQNRLGISCCHPNENLLSRNWRESRLRKPRASMMIMVHIIVDAYEH